MQRIVTVSAFIFSIAIFCGSKANRVADICPQPFKYCSRRVEVFLVVGKDFFHQFFSLSLVAGLRRLDKSRHRPSPAKLGVLALESYIVLDHFETKTRQGQNERISRYRQEVQ